MAEADWIMVRIRRDTHAELRRVERSLRIAEEMGLVELPKDDRDRVALDAVIRRLIAIRDRHAERRAKAAAHSRRRRREARVTPETPASGSSSATPETPASAGEGLGEGEAGGEAGAQGAPSQS